MNKVLQVHLFYLAVVFVVASFLFLTNVRPVFAADESTTETLVTNAFQGGGTARGWQGDDEEWIYTLPFTFPFYGTSYTNIKVGSNGVICLSVADDCTWTPETIDEAFGPFIVPLAMDLTTDNHDIYITENSDNVVIRWQVTEYGGSNVINFETVLYSNGSIEFNYGSFGGVLSYGPIVGILKGDGVLYTASVYSENDTFDFVQTSQWLDTVPMVTLSANPYILVSGVSTSATLTWSSVDTDTCTASDGWSGTKSTSGSEIISGITTNTTFTITCVGPGGSRSVSTEVVVRPDNYIANWSKRLGGGMIMSKD